MGELKEPIRLRTKKLSNGNSSLYLDIYQNGRRQYEFLKLYLVAEKTKADKERNKETLSLANSIKSQRILDLQNSNHGVISKSKSNITLQEYFQTQLEKKAQSANFWIWKSTYEHLCCYEENQKSKLSDIDKHWAEDFVEYLNEAQRIDNHSCLAQNTKVIYFQCLKTCLKFAVSDSFISRNPFDGVKPPAMEETTRMYLTLDEVKLLAQTPCDDLRVKDAFLFSCLTGLRKSDILKLKWEDVHKQGEFTRIIFRQKKTKRQEYLDISPQAVGYMGAKKKDCDFVFANDLPNCPKRTNAAIKKWVKKAGINKHITFHCARHTFATMMLSLGTDLYTVSKLLGHREIATTQIYARILDKNKQNAVLNIPCIVSKD